jgi:hypothetical protein
MVPLFFTKLIPGVNWDIKMQGVWLNRTKEVLIFWDMIFLRCSYELIMAYYSYIAALYGM